MNMRTTKDVFKLPILDNEALERHAERRATSKMEVSATAPFQSTNMLATPSKMRNMQMNSSKGISTYQSTFRNQRNF